MPLPSRFNRGQRLMHSAEHMWRGDANCVRVPLCEPELLPTLHDMCAVRVKVKPKKKNREETEDGNDNPRIMRCNNPHGLKRRSTMHDHATRDC